MSSIETSLLSNAGKSYYEHLVNSKQHSLPTTYITKDKQTVMSSNVIRYRNRKSVCLASSQCLTKQVHCESAGTVFLARLKDAIKIQTF